MLTSAARETLTEVQTVIVDEVHAVAGTKRGAHLALSLERLDQLLDKPAQRIGLSATVRPPEEVARFLSGQARTTIVAPPASKTFDLSVTGAGARYGQPREQHHLARRRGAHRRSDRGAQHRRSSSPIHGGWPSDSRRVSTRFTPTAPASNCRWSATRRWAAVPGTADGQRSVVRRPDAACPRAPRFGQQGAARAGRGRSQVRSVESRCSDVQPGVGHRHGRGRSGDPGRSTAVSRQRVAAHRPRGSPGR